jgi:hypothetical protein
MNSTKSSFGTLLFFSVTLSLFSYLLLYINPDSDHAIAQIFAGLVGVFAYLAISSLHTRVLELENQIANSESVPPSQRK